MKNSFKAWDEQRGPWDVVYYLGTGITHSPDVNSEPRTVKPAMRSIPNVYITPARLPPVDEEDWEDEVEALFEWVGLASLGSQRSAFTYPLFHVQE